MILFKECFRTAPLIRFKVYSFVTPFPNAEVLGLRVTQSACGFILALIGSFLFADKKGVHVHLCFLPLLRDLMQTIVYSWGSAVLAQLYRELWTQRTLRLKIICYDEITIGFLQIKEKRRTKLQGLIIRFKRG